MADTKDFYFKLFAREYLTSGEIRELPLEAQGILPRLWSVCCLEGSMPADLEDLSIAAGVKVSHLRSHMRSLMRFFCEGEDGRLFSRRMERERNARLRVSEGASKAAKAKHDKEKAPKQPPAPPALAPANAAANAPAVNSSELIVKNTEAQAHSKDSCAAPAGPDAPPASPVLYLVPCSGTGAKTWPLTQAKLDEWTQAFPAVDVKAELRKAIQWLKDNPANAKTFRGMPAYFGRWLSKAQDRTPTTPTKGAPYATRTPHHRAGIDAAYIEQLSGRQPAPAPADEEVLDLWARAQGE